MPGFKNPSGVIVYRFTPSTFSDEIAKIENILNRGGTVTHVDQEKIINSTISGFLKNKILDDKYFDRYFNRTTAPDWIKEKWENFTIWLLG